MQKKEEKKKIRESSNSPPDEDSSPREKESRPAAATSVPLQRVGARAAAEDSLLQSARGRFERVLQNQIIYYLTRFFEAKPMEFHIGSRG